MYDWRPPRAVPAAASLAIVGLMGAALVFGLGARHVAERSLALVSVDIRPPAPTPTPTPPPRQPQPKTERPAAKREPSPRNVRNQAAQVVAPPVTPLIPPPPVPTAPEPGLGSAPNTGASLLPGPGRGAGGIGNGDGGGGSGGDGGGAAVVGPRRIRGDLGYDDLPKGVLRFGEEAAVQVLFTVNADGTVSQCEAVRSSGYSVIDTVACQLIERRFRFRPARDRAGRAVRSKVTETHTWVEDGR